MFKEVPCWTRFSENKHDLKAHLDIIISLCEVILASHKTIEVDIN